MANIKKELFSGVFYTAIAKYSGIIIALVVTGILSRLLTSTDFGVVAIATVIISFFNIFTDIGLSAAIIQKKDFTEEDLSNIFSFTIWVGIGVSVLFFLCSWAIGVYYESSTLITLCQMLSINLLFASVNIVPNALFYKNKEFRFLAIRTLSVQLLAGAIAIFVALMGGGLYALLINPILSSILLFVISYKRYPQKVRLTWGLVSIRKIFSYSAYQFLFNIINYFSRNLDKLLIGKYMGMSLLGYYEKSYRTMMLPLQNITQVITPVMHPIFSDYQNDLNRLAAAYEKIIRFLAFIGFPLTVLLFFTAKEIILILYGDQWVPSIPVFRILSLSVGIQVILASSGSIFQAANDTRSMFMSGLFSAILNVAGIIIGIFVFQSFQAVAWCICLTFTINFIQCYWIMYRVTMKRNMLLLYRQLISPVIVSLILTGALYGISLWVDEWHIFISLAVKSIISLIIFTCYIQFSNTYNVLGKAKSILSKSNTK